MIEFRLNGRPIRLDVDPAERLLDLLRYRLDLTGTKEGCAEGECGACTVYLDDLPVDACLVPAYQAHGREVVTVEASDRRQLEPFLRSGATQCGACTPGVVMTAAWIRDHPDLLETHDLRELMAGNLCRCTGYDGIIDGVESALTAHSVDNADAATESNRSASAPVKPTSAAAVSGGGAVHRPSSLSEALELLDAEPDALPIAGGTDLLVHWPTRLDAHDRTYVDLTGVTSLRAHDWTPNALVLGGLTTYWDVIRDTRARAEFPLLVDAGRQVGAVQIQTRGTWAGNIVNASPAADGVPVLMAYDAVVDLASTDGLESIRLDEFFSGYKEMRMSNRQLITAIRLPRRAYDVAWFDKVGSRAAQAITKVGLAVTRRAEPAEDRWRVVANSVAPTVRRCATVERLLGRREAIGSPRVLAEAFARDVAPIDDIRSTRAYRSTVLSRLLYFGLRKRVDFVT
ncbi:MAG: FAD binding domain-containing protein [Gemmatimonadetes bacterium]|nr:FAD binding domain-containing protein [Gemmatimonadota bacterium]